MQSQSIRSRLACSMNLAVLCLMFTCTARTQPLSGFPRLLPPPEDFRLTLQEGTQGGSPLGPSCGGEASLTLMCRPFSLMLENVSDHTIHISGLCCEEQWVRFEKKLPPGHSAMWWTISTPEQPRCGMFEWINIRLRPGEHTNYETRLVSPRRNAEDFEPGIYTIRANWELFGCTEIPEGTDCLTQLLDSPGPIRPASVEMQEPVIVYSNELVVESPNLGDLGSLNFALEVRVSPDDLSKAGFDAASGCAADKSSISCTTFHFAVRNLADRPIRNATFTCSQSDIIPEYLDKEGTWKALSTSSWGCAQNVLIETTILPGATVEGVFTLPTLAPRYDISPLRRPGAYTLRFRFVPQACIASPDGRLCLTYPKKQPSAISSELAVRVPPDETGP
jgi:hypothetical protein